MIVDPRELEPSALYPLMISAIVPRPIAFVSTVGSNGQFNVAPFSYFNAISDQPPLVGISISRRRGSVKDTLRNIRDTGDFVVNVVTEPMLERVVQASGDLPPEVDEFALTGLTPVPSGLVKAPRVGESPINMECRLEREIELGQAHLVVGEILRFHVADGLLSEGRVDIARLKPVGRLGGDQYTRVRVDFRVPRPGVERTTPGA